MSLIKLNAIDSTNDYLKQLSKIAAVENFTIVMANEQTHGKGQMGSKWISEPGKNLTMSILVTNFNLKKHTIFDLNVVMAVSILKVLQSFKIQHCKIKWPNDIMADSKKVGGILIENSLKQDGSVSAVIGVGLNLNQTNFKELPQATSLFCVSGATYSPENIALLLKNSLQKYLQIIAKNQDVVWDEYHQNLFKIHIPSAFEDKTGKQFMGIVQKVTRDGKLEVRLEDDTTTYFNVKDVKMLY